MSQPNGIPSRIVTPTAGLQAWTRHAYDVLVETASRYNAVITQSELAAEVQSRSGLHTDAQPRSWIPQVLTLITHQCHRKGEPPLTALVVHKDGQVGSAYNDVLRVADLAPIDDALERENHAAAARLECYRRWCPYVPEDATPTLVTRARTAPSARTTSSGRTASSGRSGAGPRTANPRRTQPAEVRRGALCPTCFMEMPLAGDCPNCA